MIGWRMLAYLWASPVTAIGAAAALLAVWRGQVALHRGVVEAHGPLLRWVLTHLSVLPGGIAAITLGHVVLARDAHALDSTRAHERVHVAQYERWGPFMLPAYVIASAWAWTRGRHVYFDNPFERQAFGDHQGHEEHFRHEGHFGTQGTKDTKATKATKANQATKSTKSKEHEGYEGL